MSEASPDPVNPDLKSLRSFAKEAGIKGYSRMRKRELIEAVEYARKKVVVYKGDTAVTRKLGSKFLRECEVSEYRNNGTRSRPQWEVRAWFVSQSILDQHGLTPLPKEVVAEKTAKRSEVGRRAWEDRLDAARDRTGALPTGRLAKNIAMGRCDLSDGKAELNAFIAKYRHEHTNYEELLDTGCDRDSARHLKTEDPWPNKWDDYLSEYEFDSDEARAIASVLLSSSKCSPIWFKKAEIAVRWARLDLTKLSYEVICDSIRSWQSSCD